MTAPSARRVAVIDAGGANLGSVCYALERLGVAPVLVRDGAALAAATCAILPGVGTAREGMRRLHAQDLVAPLRELPLPLLGICLGMQLLHAGSEEGDVECLGLLPGRVVRMAPGPGVRIPHMGWNRLQGVADVPLLAGIAEGDSAYFVHGYAAPPGPDTVASATHGTPFSAIVQRGRLCGAQFHPERSADVGARLLRNFIEGAPA